MLRHLFRQQVRAVAEGRDPLGVSFRESDARYVIAGNFVNP